MRERQLKHSTAAEKRDALVSNLSTLKALANHPDKARSEDSLRLAVQIERESAESCRESARPSTLRFLGPAQSGIVMRDC